MDLDAVWCDILGVSRSPAALVNQVGGISLVAIVMRRIYGAGGEADSRGRISKLRETTVRIP